jgi:ParB/RepB/Spo0J family partition protein
MSATTHTHNGHAPPAAGPAPDVPVLIVPHGQVKPWPGNPRKTFPESSLQELAASVRARGVLQPLLVRPLGNDAGLEDGPYELADGERRWRAAQLAGLRQVPVRVLRLADADMLEIAVISNEQREDVQVLEKAEGYRRLQAEGRSTEAIAAKVGKSVTTVRALLRLLELPDAARQDLLSGRLPAETAQLIATVPGKESRERFALMVLTNNNYGVPDAQELKRRRESGVPPMSSRAAKDLIQSRFRCQLKGSPFDQADATLPGGSCKACPKRAGNSPELRADGVRADVCTDPDCFKQKVAAFQERELERAKDSGRTVLKGKEAAACFPYGRSLSSQAPYFDLGEQCWEDRAPGHRTYGQLLKGHVADAAVVLCPDRDGELHYLVHKDTALPLLRKHHGLYKGSGAFNGSARTSEEEKKERQRRAFENKVYRETASGVLARAAHAAKPLFAALPPDQPQVNQVLRVIAADLLHQAYPTAVEDVCRRRGLKGHTAYLQKEELARLVEAAPAAEVLALCAELSAARHCLGGHGADGHGKALNTALGIDKAKLEKEVRARLKEGRAATKGRGREAPAPEPDGTNPVTRADALIRLLPAELKQAAAALMGAGLTTLGQLLDRAGCKAGERASVSKVYQVLRDAAGAEGNAVGDALVDAGLIGEGAKPVPAGEPAPAGAGGERAPAPPPAGGGAAPAAYRALDKKHLRRKAAHGDAGAAAELKRRGLPLVGKRGRPKKGVPGA